MKSKRCFPKARNFRKNGAFLPLLCLHRRMERLTETFPKNLDFCFQNACSKSHPLNTKIIALALVAASHLAQAQEIPQTPLVPAPKARNQYFYLTWGYNAETYTRSNLHVSQPEIGYEYTMHKVHGHDFKGWDKGIFNQELTIPQYSYRIGWMFDKKRGMGVEINFDHTKYIISENQTVRVTGTLGDARAVDTNVYFDRTNGFTYFLNNGANFFLINFVKQVPVWENKRHNLRLDVLGKAGIGPVVPHVETTLFGKANNPHFQLGGWNVGLELDAQVTAFNRVFLEGGIKGDYARYSGLRIYKGTARQAFGSFIMFLGLGVRI